MSGRTMKAGMIALALNFLLAARPVQAGDWWVIAHDTNFCSTPSGSHNWNWRGNDANCHSFVNPDNGGSCVYTTYEGTTGSAVNCYDKPPQDVYIPSMSYLEGMGNGGVGCIFWSNADCTGAIESVTYLDEVQNCYEFNSISPLSFSCGG